MAVKKSLLPKLKQRLMNKEKDLLKVRKTLNFYRHHKIKIKDDIDLRFMFTKQFKLMEEKLQNLTQEAFNNLRIMEQAILTEIKNLEKQIRYVLVFNENKLVYDEIKSSLPQFDAEHDEYIRGLKVELEIFNVEKRFESISEVLRHRTFMLNELIDLINGNAYNLTELLELKEALDQQIEKLTHEKEFISKQLKFLDEYKEQESENEDFLQASIDFKEKYNGNIFDVEETIDTLAAKTFFGLSSSSDFAKVLSPKKPRF